MTEDIVYTVEDYWDGPREGFASFEGRLHHYRSIFDSAADDWSEQFVLTPIEKSFLPAVMESWEIWRRWEQAFKRGETTEKTHPALPPDRARREQLKELLTSAVQAGENRKFVADGKFQSTDSRLASALTEPASLRVIWQVAAA